MTIDKIVIGSKTFTFKFTDIQAAKSSGMNEHMAKPIDLGRLMEVLGRWLR